MTTSLLIAEDSRCHLKFREGTIKRGKYKRKEDSATANTYQYLAPPAPPARPLRPAPCAAPGRAHPAHRRGHEHPAHRRPNTSGAWRPTEAQCTLRRRRRLRSPPEIPGTPDIPGTLCPAEAPITLRPRRRLISPARSAPQEPQSLSGRIAA